MTNDITIDGSGDATSNSKLLLDESVADPVAEVLLLQQEAGTRQQEDIRITTPLKQAVVKERLLRRMLENSLKRPISTKRPHLKIVK